MPDSKAGSWAEISGNEIVNASRTIAYIKNFGLPLSVDEDCWCGNTRELLGDCETATGAGPGGSYQYPSTDTAPWYDPAIPESGDFLGFLPTSVEGLTGSTFKRENSPTLTGGAILGRLRAEERVITWRGWIFGRTCCAAEYGLRWLTSTMQFAGGCDGCDGADLDVMICCPETTGQAATSMSCGEGDPTVPDIGTMKASDAFRTFYRVGLADGPRDISTRTIGCGSCEDQGTGCMKEIEFSLVAGNPFAHKDPICIPCEGVLPPCGDCPGDAEAGFWQKINTTSYPASTTDAEQCDSLLECQVEPADCVDDPSCPSLPLPEIPGFEDPCGCTPYNTTQFCCKIDNDLYGEFFEAIPYISVFSGSEDLHNVTIRFYENPQERDCDDSELFDICNLCDEINIRFVPKNSTLILDGLTRTINIECPGANVNSAEGLVTTTFRWPTLKCVGYIVTVSADCNWPVAPNNHVSIKITPREM